MFCLVMFTLAAVKAATVAHEDSILHGRSSGIAFGTRSNRLSDLVGSGSVLERVFGILVGKIFVIHNVSFLCIGT